MVPCSACIASRATGGRIGGDVARGREAGLALERERGTIRARTNSLAAWEVGAVSFSVSSSCGYGLYYFCSLPETPPSSFGLVSSRTLSLPFDAEPLFTSVRQPLKTQLSPSPSSFALVKDSCCHSRGLVRFTCMRLYYIVTSSVSLSFICALSVCTACITSGGYSLFEYLLCAAALFAHPFRR